MTAILQRFTQIRRKALASCSHRRSPSFRFHGAEGGSILPGGTGCEHHSAPTLPGGEPRSAEVAATGGRLPDEATRQRMAQLVDSVPPAPAPAPPPQQQAPQGPAVALSAAILDRYVGEWTTAGGNTITFRRDGATLFVKPGTLPEVPLTARSETRFSDPRGPVFEFQLDGQGKLIGLILEQGNPSQRVPLVRK